MPQKDFSLFQRKVIDIEEHGLAGAMAVMFEWKYFLLLAAVFGMLAGVFLAVRSTPRFSADSSFVSASILSGTGSGVSMAALSSAASSLGLDLGGPGNDLSPLFPWILESRQLGEKLLLVPVLDQDGKDTCLLDMLVPAEADTTFRLDNGLNILHSGVLMHRYESQSRVTTLTVSLTDPVVAAKIANFAVQYLDEFNILERKEQAGRQVEFLELRLEQIEEDFSVAEIALMDFRIANRKLNGSPHLLLEEARLRRSLELAQQLYLTLKTKLEIVRLDEIKNFPLISVIDRAWLPSHATKSSWLRLSVVGTMLGVIMGLLMVFALNQLRLVQDQARQKGLTGPKSI